MRVDRWFVVAVIVAAGCGGRATPAPAPVVVAAPAAPPPAAGAFLPRVGVAAAETDEDRVDRVVAAGDAVAWIRADGALRRARLGGGEVTTVARLDAPGPIALAGDDLYAVDGDHLVRYRGAGGAAETVATGVDGTALAIADDVVAIAGPSGLGVVGADGAYRALVADPGAVVGLAVADGWIYWADHGVRPPRRGVGQVRRCSRDLDGTVTCTAPAPRLGAIRRVAVAGGAVETVAADLNYPVGLAVVGDHVIWSGADGEALMRAPVTGGTPQIALRGRGGAVDADADGAVVRTTAGLVIEVPTRGATRVLASSADDDPPLAVTAGWVVAVDGGAVVAYPRGAGRVTVLASARGRINGLALDGDQLYYLDVRRDGDLPDRIMAVPTHGGRARTVARLDGELAHLAVDGATIVAVDDARGVIVTAAGREVAHDVVAQAVAVRGDRVMWLDGAELYRAPLAGGEPEALLQPEFGYGSSGRPPDGTILVGAADVVACAGLSGGVYRLTATGHETLRDDASQCARDGDRVLAWVDERGLVDAVTGEVVVADAVRYGEGLVVHGGAAWALLSGDGGVDLVRLPLGAGAAEVVIPDVGLPAWLAADDDGVYLSWSGADVVLRVAP
ncbi:MAG: hypothetical protein H6708_21475 [Kofleriaceae bacterium]|nr:hypothetical protein [Kofleriaceae bacterium]